MDKHSSFLRKSVNYGRNKFYETGPDDLLSKIRKIGFKANEHFEVLFNRRHDSQHNGIQHNDIQHNNAIHYAECRVLFIVMLSLVKLSFVMLSLVMLSLVMPLANTLVYCVHL